MSRSAALLEGLNAQQRAACVHDGSHLLVVAGAGSGKTRVLTQRMAYLVAEGRCRPDEILAITFTNKAAEEMRQRVEQALARLGLMPGERPELATFHAFGARLLRRYGAAVGLAAGFSIYDETEQAGLARGCEEVTAIAETGRLVRSLLQKFSRFKDEGLGPAEVLQAATTDHDAQVARAYAAYEVALRRANAVDFGDLILLPLRILQEQQEIAARLHRRFRYVLVDEYQDTNRTQIALLRAVLGRESLASVVGDDDQSIYTWRGAQPGNLLGFLEAFSGAEVIKLEQNYRSTTAILDVAGDIIAENTTRMEKRLWTARQGGAPVGALWAETETSEARFVAQEIRRSIGAAHRQAGDFAVLFRTNAQSRPFEEQLRRAGLPYRVLGGIGFYERAEVKDLLAYLRLLVNPADTMAFSRVVNVPARGIGSKALATMGSHLASRRVRPPGTLRFDDDGAETAGLEGWLAVLEDVAAERIKIGNRRSVAGARDLLDLLLAARSLAQTAHPAVVLEEILRLTGYEAFAVQRAKDEAVLLHIQDLIGAARSYVATGEDATLVGFLESLALRHSEAPPEEDCVTLMTVHAAKGLEFPVVFLCGLEEDLLPLRRSESEQDLEEERRLAYVACTRAEEQLFLTAARSRRLYNQVQRPLPSRFFLMAEKRPLRWVDESGGVLTRPPRLNVIDDEVREWRGKARGEGAGAASSGGAAVSLVWQKRRAARQEAAAEASGEPVVIYDEEGPGAGGLGQAKGGRAVAAEGEPFSLGTSVTHRRYGVGRVLAVQDGSEGQVVTVDFPMAGKKKILAGFLRRF